MNENDRKKTMKQQKWKAAIILCGIIVMVLLINVSAFAEGLSAGVAEKKEPSKSDPYPYPMPYTDKEPQHNQRVKDPYFLLTPTLSPDIPLRLRPHSRLLLTDIEDRPFFDCFGWQTFIGLIWPADPNNRGAADPNVKSAADFKKVNRNNGDPSTPAVWETFQNVNTLFPGSSAPDSSEPAPPPKWNATIYERPFNLTMMSKGRHPENLNEAFSSPLIDQNRQYVRYNIRFNKVMYEHVRHNGWYLKKNLPKSAVQASLPPLSADIKKAHITQPQTNTVISQPIRGNSIEIKSSWRLMITPDDLDPAKPWRKADDLSRYYVAEAIIRDAVTGEKRVAKMGLVGLHLVEKTPIFTEGLWFSFEHRDNLKIPPVAPYRASFNGSGEFYKTGYSYKPAVFTSENTAPTEDKRLPVEVSRIYKIPDTPMGTVGSKNFPYGYSTRGINKRYRELLKGTVWENYELVISQWPTDPTSFYAKPFLYPRGFPYGVPEDQPLPVKQAYERAKMNATNAYPRWSGLPIPQFGALNTTMETYFQAPPYDPENPNQLEDSSCMGCHYGASDMGYSWALKLRTWPQPFNQGRIDNKGVEKPAHTR